MKRERKTAESVESVKVKAKSHRSFTCHSAAATSYDLTLWSIKDAFNLGIYKLIVGLAPW